MIDANIDNNNQKKNVVNGRQSIQVSWRGFGWRLNHRIWFQRGKRVKAMRVKM